MQPTITKNETLRVEEKLSWLQLARTENVGPITFYNFLDYYGSADKALEAIPEIAKRSNRKRPLSIPPRAVIEKEYDLVTRKGGQMITAVDAAYPLALSAIEDAPPVITVFGDAGLMQKPCIGVVGARNASLNGRKFAEKLSRDLGEAGQVVVSGLARGIDTAAHNGALEEGTIAVVAGGIDVVYPSENQKLYEQICERGLVIAENPLGVSPRAQDFPRRNRIVSGISQGIVVIEATLRSGSLITARLAGEQGRDVYAVPGHPMDPRASGPNALIRDGATLIRSAEDVLENVRNFTGGGLEDSGVSRFTPSLTPQAANDAPAAAAPASAEIDEAREMVMAGLSYMPVEINELIRQSGAGTAMVQTILLELELVGDVQRLPGNRVMLVNND